MTGKPILMVVDVTPWSAGLEAPTPAGSTAIVAPRTTTRLAMNVRPLSNYQTPASPWWLH